MIEWCGGWCRLHTTTAVKSCLTRWMGDAVWCMMWWVFRWVGYVDVCVEQIEWCGWWWRWPTRLTTTAVMICVIRWVVDVEWVDVWIFRWVGYVDVCMCGSGWVMWWMVELPRLTGLPVITSSHLNRFTEPVRVAANRCFGHSTRTFILM